MSACKRRGYRIDRERFNGLEDRRRGIQSEMEGLQARRNSYSKEVGLLKATEGDPTDLMGKVAEIKGGIDSLEREFDAVCAELDRFLLDIPNLLQPDVPDGAGETDNPTVRSHLGVPSFPFEPKDHVALGEALGMISFEDAVSMAGNRFVVLRSQLCSLHRALIHFMLDKQTRENGYEEIYVPVLVNHAAMQGTGQLPKFEEDLFRVERDGFYLAPTAEVPVTNMVRDRILDAADLPLKFACHAPCFRREAGSYGKDTRGMLRQHQFEKVELVHISHPDRSQDALEELVSNAESILKDLALPYRVVMLCSGETGFAANKTYDIEVWLPGQARYREISSCSNCGDFQARRMMARFRDGNGRNRLVHTLNGSGIAVGRALIAVVENGQGEDGSIGVPEVLRPYMGGIDRIDAIR